MAVIRVVALAFWAAVFLVLLLFAIKNVDLVTVHFLFGSSWEAPLVFVMLAAFAFGAVFGAAACIAPLLRQRRQVQRLTKELKLRSAQSAPPSRPAVPDVPLPL